MNQRMKVRRLGGHLHCRKRPEDKNFIINIDHNYYTKVSRSFDNFLIFFCKKNNFLKLQINKHIFSEKLFLNN